MPRSLEQQSSLDRTLIALSLPARRRILERLARGSHRASDACRGLKMSRPAVSKHLGVLRRAGLVVVVPRGRERVYRLAPQPRGLAEARAYFEQVSSFWDQALLAFKTFAEKDTQR